MTSPAEKRVAEYLLSVPLMTSAGKYPALPFWHPTNRNAEE